MTIALHTMVKNGREKLPALFKSVRDFVDKALILDTGSTDDTINWLNTQTIIPDTFVMQDSFVDFGESRTRGIEWCQGKADWILLLDDDMSLRFDLPIHDIKSQLDPMCEAYLIRVDQTMTYWNTRVVVGNRPWKYIGVTHEYLDGALAAVKLDGVVIEHKYNHGPEKFTRDARLLASDIARDPDNPRTIFYLAQTFRDQGRSLAAIRYYELRVRMGGWDQEVFFSMYEAARLANDPAAMERAFAFRPSRAEPAWWLREYYKINNRPDLEAKWELTRSQIPMSKDILFVYTNCYE